jgi:hypothetical protein
LSIQFCSDEASDGEQLRLLVELEGLLTVKMNGECRDPHDWPLYLDQTLFNVPVLGSHHGPSRDAQISVEPGMP